MAYMKKLSITCILFCIISMMNAQNPFFERYNTPHETVPFDKIKTDHFEPAIREGIRQQIAEIDAITDNPETPTFANTILAYENSGELLDRVVTVFDNLCSAETNDTLQALAQEMMPLLSEHGNNISLNESLFNRVKIVYQQKEQESLTPEQLKLLEKIYDSFIRNGANLQGEAKEKYRKLTKDLSSLTLQFAENNLKEINNYQLVVTDEKQLAGLPESAVEAAEETAKEKGIKGWMFTLQAPSFIPFMTYADNSELRKELYFANSTKCTHDNEFNNIEIVKNIVNTRMR